MRFTVGGIKSHQMKVRTVFFYVNGTGTAAISIGKDDGTLTDNGTGDYTVTLRSPGKQILGLSVCPTTKVYAHEASSSGKDINIKTFNDAGSATDAAFFLTVWVSDSKYLV